MIRQWGILLIAVLLMVGLAGCEKRGDTEKVDPAIQSRVAEQAAGIRAKMEDARKALSKAQVQEKLLTDSLQELQGRLNELEVEVGTMGETVRSLTGAEVAPAEKGKASAEPEGMHWFIKALLVVAIVIIVYFLYKGLTREEEEDFLEEEEEDIIRETDLGTIRYPGGPATDSKTDGADVSPGADGGEEETGKPDHPAS